MQNDKLLPCPFCGSDKLKMDSKNGRIHYHEKDGMKEWQNVVYSVRCNKCHARGGTVSADLPTMGILGDYKIKRDKVIEDCINKWNTREPMGDVASKVQQVIWDSCCGDEYKYASKEIEKIFDEVYVEGGVDNAG